MRQVAVFSRNASLVNTNYLNFLSLSLFLLLIDLRVFIHTSFCTLLSVDRHGA